MQPRNAFFTGLETIGPSPAQINSSERLFNGITLLAPSGNISTIFFGPTNVVSSSTGFPLTPGFGLYLEVDTPNLIYAMSPSGNQKLSWVGT